MDIALLLFLILMNGIFAMSEMAVVSSRRARLQKWADDGLPGAKAAVELQNAPSHFLSTIQVGITAVGILSGALGENALAGPLAGWLREWPLVAPYAEGIALALVVLIMTYFSVVIGELVPKRMALLGPERVASIIARPMTWLSKVTRPLVWVLSSSSDLLLRLLRANRSDEPPVTDEEIKVMMEQGAEAGIFHETEHALVSNVLRLDEQRITAIMTPRNDIYAIDLEDPMDQVHRCIIDSPYSRIVVVRGGVENVLGILNANDYLKRALAGKTVAVEETLRVPLYVPETVSTTQVLEAFRKGRVQMALIVDEYGGLQGVVTLTDVLTAIVGDLPAEGVPEAADAVQREDGSWLIDGSMPIERFKHLMDIDRLSEDEEDRFHTMSGFVMDRLGRIPSVADRFEHGGWSFEIVDMDKNRVDKLLVAPLPVDDSGES
jgi:putative hemolysin